MKFFRLPAWQQLVSAYLGGNVAYERGAYLCDLSLVEGSPNSKWIRDRKKIRVMDKEPGKESFAEIEILPDGKFKVSLEGVSLYHCGAGSEFPKYIIMKRSGGTCLVKKGQ